MVHSLPGSPSIVDADERIGSSLSSGGHDMHAKKFEAPRFLIVDGECNGNYRVDLAPGRKVMEELVARCTVRDVIQQHVIVRLPELSFDAVEHFRKKPS